MSNMEKFSSPEEPSKPVSQDTMNAFESMLAPDKLVPGSTQEPTFTDKDTTGEGYGIPETNNQETAPADTSNIYDRTANALGRVTAVLEKLSAGAPARQEARAEMMETATDKVKRIGRGALKGAKLGGLFTVGIAVLSTEFAANKVGQVSTEIRSKITIIGTEARKRYAERRAYRENKRLDLLAADRAEADTMNRNYAEHSEANVMNQNYAEHSEADTMNQNYAEHVEADGMNHNFFEHVEANEMNQHYAEHSEALEDDKKFNKQRKLQERREAALARKNRRREVYMGFRERGSDVYNKAKRYGKRFGHAALKTFKRVVSAGRAAASGAVSAGAAAWSESATSSAPSN